MSQRRGLYQSYKNSPAADLLSAADTSCAGKFAVVGTYDGRCIFFSTDQLKYHTTIHVRSARGKNSRGRKASVLMFLLPPASYLLPPVSCLLPLQ